MEEFRNIGAMIVDPTGYSRDLLRSILITLGVLDIFKVGSTIECLSALRAQHRDVVFCDELAGDCADFMMSLRRDTSTHNITIPVFLVSAGVQEQQVTAARDAGLNSVIVKPVSLATVERKLRATLQTPKDFVTSKTFIGPDRRANREDRRQAGDRPGFTERRRSSPSAELFAVPPTLPREPT